MGRKRAKNGKFSQILNTLLHYGVEEEFARSVTKTYITKGPGTALVELYAGGWEPFLNVKNHREQHVTLERTLGRKDNGEEESKKDKGRKKKASKRSKNRVRSSVKSKKVAKKSKAT